ncbi:flavin reductase family protein [Neobacillus ginsengisoli]|uniref:Flavin reductase (DIM6/NTAB) family NADH-FMN oxidoreductase RutF n=1 Tax=Neobacillus ginsengisoli TaxID=904295 RepID=A0ABT9XXT1_9BACI|nr:flavin reductase family protein [Neobacillus ginsengisoli]MDQ0200161.1 flavin reductase (DIM6/NTAB) family NADH-FMN oxidoreductase RutF [Neobacillus ginsengisoli]
MDDRFFRNAMGKFATGITVVSTEVKGEAHGMTANAFVSVSLNPKLILVSIDKRAKMLGLIQESKKFAVSFLAGNQQAESMRFAGQLKGDTPYSFEQFNELPVIQDALANITCTLYNEVEAGDHVLFIGEVTDLKVSEGDPLLYYQGKYRELTAIEPTEP